MLATVSHMIGQVTMQYDTIRSMLLRCLTMFKMIFSFIHLLSFHFILPYPILSYATLPYPILRYPTLSYPTLPYHTPGGRSHSDLVCWDLRNTRCELGRVKRVLTSNQKMSFSLDPWGKYLATGTQDGKYVLTCTHMYTRVHAYLCSHVDSYVDIGKYTHTGIHLTKYVDHSQSLGLLISHPLIISFLSLHSVTVISFLSLHSVTALLRLLYFFSFQHFDIRCNDLRARHLQR
jgi:hypothetical protein